MQATHDACFAVMLRICTNVWSLRQMPRFSKTHDIVWWTCKSYFPEQKFRKL